MGLIPEMSGWLDIQRAIKIIYHIKRLRKKNHMVILIDTEKSSGKIQHSLMIKILKIWIRGELPQLDEGHLHDIYNQYYTQWWKTKCPPSKTGNKARMYSPTSLTQYSAGSSRQRNKASKENKRHTARKEEESVFICR